MKRRWVTLTLVWVCLILAVLCAVYVSASGAFVSALVAVVFLFMSSKDWYDHFESMGLYKAHGGPFHINKEGNCTCECDTCYNETDDRCICILCPCDGEI